MLNRTSGRWRFARELLAVAIGPGFLSFALLFPPALHAYDDPGHFFTVSAILHHLRSSVLSRDEREVVAFCAWLPDETRELNAVSVAADAGLESGAGFAGHPVCEIERLFGGCPTILPKDTGGPMVIVQQLLHGLAGGNSAAVTEVASDLVKSFAEKVRESKPDRDSDYGNRLCALGFSLHLYGDSFAHRELENDSRMYDTGWGHARAQNHPDHPCIATSRERAWKGYALRVGEFFDAQSPPVDNVAATKLTYIDGHCVGAPDSTDDDDNDTTLRNLLEQLLPPANGGQWFTQPRHYVLKDPCEAYVRSNRRAGTIPSITFSCRRTWHIYKEQAYKAFFNSPVRGAIGFKYPADYYEVEPQWLQ